MKVPFLVIGSGLSGLAAAIRIAHYCPDVLLLEQHSRIGGLNSYYYRNKRLLETGLHAITNYASAKDKKAPINKLFRQLKIKRSTLQFKEQLKSEIHFGSELYLQFSNDISLLQDEVNRLFPHVSDKFTQLIEHIVQHDPFKITRFQSTRIYLNEYLGEPQLVDMLLCPLCYYGSSVENDMDFNQFVIMFKSIFLEGMFRPEGNMKDFLTILRDKYQQLGGTLKMNAKVSKILYNNKKAHGIELDNGDVIEADHILSTAGYEETLKLVGKDLPGKAKQRLGFIESIFLVENPHSLALPSDKTIIFFNNGQQFKYQNPEEHADFTSGVICFPQNFNDIPKTDPVEVRLTHLANFEKWSSLFAKTEKYHELKNSSARQSVAAAEKIIGNFNHNIVYQDTFTPVTIQRYTLKKEGAIYGSPLKIKDGDIGFDNLFIAGTDQGFLGIIGSMLSGVSIANQHFLPKI